MQTLIIEISIGEQKLNFSFPNNEKGQRAAEKKVKEIIAGVYDMAAHKYTKKLRSTFCGYWRNQSKKYLQTEKEEREYLTKHQLTKPKVSYSAYYI